MEKSKIEDKIKTKKEVEQIADSLRKQGKKIVTTNGSFDVLHYGHVWMLEQAKQLGDVLFVGLNSDSSVKQYKSKDRPIIPQEFRAKLLAALSCVDYVTIFDETIPNDFLEHIKPDVHVNEASYGENCVEAPVVKKYGGKLHLIEKKAELLSTTEIVNRILKVYGNKTDTKNNT